MKNRSLIVTAGTIAVAVMIAIVHGSPIHAQSPTTTSSQREFEVASIKPIKDSTALPEAAICHGSDAPAKFPAGIGLGQCVLRNVTLKMIIQLAYGLPTTPAGSKLDQNILGMPSWADSDRFEIQTKTENATATGGELAQMFRPLLTDRFKLKMHRETREVAGLALLMAKNGSKLMKAIGDEEPQGLRVRTMESGVTVTGQRIVVSNLTGELLANRLGRPVVDPNRPHRLVQFHAVLDSR